MNRREEIEDLITEYDQDRRSKGSLLKEIGALYSQDIERLEKVVEVVKELDTIAESHVGRRLNVLDKLVKIICPEPEEDLHVQALIKWLVEDLHLSSVKSKIDKYKKIVAKLEKERAE